MQTFVTNQALQRRLEFLRNKGKTIGFCPTMGALHEGHLSLVDHSIQSCDITVVSIFVNPTQFNDKADLDKYPRPVDKDKQLLKAAKADILYLPGPKQIYPKGMDTNITINLEGLDAVLEGTFRPGHFKGVVQVVKRLLDIVKPDKLFMGQKDFQQFTIVSQMIKKLDLSVKLVVVPIMREKDGLAMSSRNIRLSLAFREKALVLQQSLKEAKKVFSAKPFEALKARAIKAIKDHDLKPEYFELVDGHTLKSLKNADESDYIVALVAAWAGNVRLIDNMILKGSCN